jgi:hypothetical protein
MELIDACYFFFDDNYQGEATSHIARMALADSLWMFCDNRHFLNSAWYERLSIVGNNPIILGFTIKNMILSSLCAFGCPLASYGWVPCYLFRQSAPITGYRQDFPVLIPPGNNQEHTAQHFVPVGHKWRYIDGIFVWWNLKAKRVTIALMQITLTTSEVASDVLFMERHWRGMVELLTDWTIRTRFVWIKETRNEPLELPVSDEEFRNTCGAGAKHRLPPYDVIVLTVRDVDIGIDDSLRAARASSATVAKF